MPARLSSPLPITTVALFSGTVGVKARKSWFQLPNSIISVPVPTLAAAEGSRLVATDCAWASWVTST
jgi:hypothetical protein